jgi:hypothetical protein
MLKNQKYLVRPALWLVLLGVVAGCTELYGEDYAFNPKYFVGYDQGQPAFRITIIDSSNTTAKADRNWLDTRAKQYCTDGWREVSRSERTLKDSQPARWIAGTYSPAQTRYEYLWTFACTNGTVGPVPAK